MLLAGCGHTPTSPVADGDSSQSTAMRSVTLPWIETEIMDRAILPQGIKQRAIWIDPNPLPRLAEHARMELSAAGYRLVDREEDASVRLKFDGSYTVWTPDSKMSNVSLASYAQGSAHEWVNIYRGRSVLERAVLDYAADSKHVTTLPQAVAAAAIGLGIEGAIYATHKAALTLATEPGPNGTIQCRPDECKRLLHKRYGTHMVTLDLIRHDDAGRQRATVRVTGISKQIDPEMLIAEASKHLLSMYTAQP
jgi:hypothetical protein